MIQLLKWVIFHSYVGLPEGMGRGFTILQDGQDHLLWSFGCIMA